MSRAIFRPLSRALSTFSHPRILRILRNPMSRPTIPLPLEQPIAWVLDFDGTVTKRDTLDALVDIAAEAKPKDTISAAWKHCTESYLSDYSAALKQYAPDSLPTTVEAEKELLEDLKEVERKSIDRVSASKIFERVTAAQLRYGAAKAVKSGRVQLRFGVNEFLHHVLSQYSQQDHSPSTVGILSVNWSRRFITACLQAARASFDKPLPEVRSMAPEFTVNTVENAEVKELHQAHSTNSPKHTEAPLWMEIFANELGGLEDGGHSTGKLCAGNISILSSHDKLLYLEYIQDQMSASGATKPIPVIYVGDSWTDFDCLLKANLGICIRDDPMTSSQRMLADSFKRLGIQCLHVHEGKTDKWGVVWAKDFEQIKEWAETEFRL
ncbi:hypothetical protein K504DRAFT_262315 [Pleomassaria siparia CBS 279.74]|uniref:HAD-like protein n=1 Tax=Pleomassaria siparia CBS 279.74 TaxID=1314801 RepID=A0A6G1KCA7_9PLEO|nr:hypothetical protein K504DRAFT_262315 [Pleomassaria siparia CBS 279.74]